MPLIFLVFFSILGKFNLPPIICSKCTANPVCICVCVGAAIYMSATSMLIQQDGSVASNNVVLHDVEIHANRAYYCGCIAAISIVFQIKGKMNYHGNYNSALYLESSYVNLMGYSTYYGKIFARFIKGQ